MLVGADTLKAIFNWALADLYGPTGNVITQSMCGRRSGQWASSPPVKSNHQRQRTHTYTHIPNPSKVFNAQKMRSCV